MEAIVEEKIKWRSLVTRVTLNPVGGGPPIRSRDVRVFIVVTMRGEKLTIGGGW